MKTLVLALAALAWMLPGDLAAWTNTRRARLKVGHLDGQGAKKNGLRVLVKDLTDSRAKNFVDPRKDAGQLGNQRGQFGEVLGRVELDGDLPLGTVLSQDFADVLGEAGFTVSAESDKDAKPDSAYDAVLWGEIRTFWLDTYMMSRHTVDLVLELTAPGGKKLVWDHAYKGRWTIKVLGALNELEREVDYTDFMQEVMDDFTSDDFLGAVESLRKKRKK